MTAPAVNRPNRNTPGRFWGRVHRTPTCWLWTGSTQAPGYGRLQYQGRVEYAHRVAYRLAVGPIAEGLQVCHHCDNPPCVRPDHLFLGTLTDNLRDASRKGRMHPGSQHGMSKLTEELVELLRRRYAMGESQRALARELGLHRNTVHAAVRGRSWAHVR